MQQAGDRVLVVQVNPELRALSFLWLITLISLHTKLFHWKLNSCFKVAHTVRRLNNSSIRHSDWPVHALALKELVAYESVEIGFNSNYTVATQLEDQSTLLPEKYIESTACSTVRQLQLHKYLEALNVVSLQKSCAVFLGGLHCILVCYSLNIAFVLNRIRILRSYLEYTSCREAQHTLT